MSAGRGDDTLGPGEDGGTALADPVAASIAFALVRGVPIEAITRETGLTLPELLSPGGRLPQRVMPAVWRQIRNTLPNDAVCLQMAAMAPVGFFGAFGIAAESAPDLESAVDLFVRFSHVLSRDVRVEKVRLGGRLAVEVGHPHDEADGGCAQEVALAMAYRLFREVLGLGDAIRWLELDHDPIGPVADYDAFFDIPVHFGCRVSAFVLDPGYLRSPPLRFDPQVFRGALARLELESAALTEADGAGEVGELRRAVGRIATRGEYGVEGLARELGVGVRTLQRRASELGLSPRALLAEAREANARALLADTALSVEEVAYLLGYSTGAAFHRAFRRWTGQSPSDWRRGLGGG